MRAQMVFDYDLEDTDRMDGSNVFNGQESVLWCNGDAFGDELREMYSGLRSGALFNYAEAVQRYADHRGGGRRRCGTRTPGRSTWSPWGMMGTAPI